LGERRIPEMWKTPFRDTLHTALAGRNVVAISGMVQETVEQIERFRCKK